MMKIMFLTLSLFIFSYSSMPLIIFMLMLMSTLFIIITYSPLTSPVLITPLFMCDALSAPLILLSMWLTALMMMVSTPVFCYKLRPALFMFIILVLMSALILCFSASSFILFYIFFEFSLPPTLALIMLWGYQPERLQAGLHMMMYTVTASLPLLAAIMFLDITTHQKLMLTYLYAPPMTLNMFMVWWVSMTLAFLVKLPLYIVHLWLPKAHVEAPAAGSMILAGILLKLGAYGLIRVSMMIQHTNMNLIPLMSSIALWGGIITSLMCLRQTDMKSLIAYASVGHMALVYAAIMSSTSWGLQGAMIMMIAHGLCSSAMFAMSGILYTLLSTRSLFLMKGLLAITPSLMLWWFLFAIANMSAPPSINLLSEILLLTSITSTSLSFILILMIISFLAAAYSLMLFTHTSHGHTNYLNVPFSPLSPSHYHLFFLHLMPLCVFILCPKMITMWLS